MKKIFKVMCLTSLLNITMLWLVILLAGVILGFETKIPVLLYYYFVVSILFIILTIFIGLIVYSKKIIIFFKEIRDL